VTNVRRAIQAYVGTGVGEHHRYRSWEHCYSYFRRSRHGVGTDRDHAALQLGFYLASWGMYRGSSFLLQHTSTVHRGVIDVVADPRFDELWETDLGASPEDVRFVPLVLELVADVAQAYAPFVGTSSGQPTDTLISKIVLGTFGCLPACDRYFIDGFKSQGLPFSGLNAKFVERVITFCQDHLPDLRAEQDEISKRSGIRYPLMKLVDMYFWQIGFEADSIPTPTLQP